MIEIFVLLFFVLLSWRENGDGSSSQSMAPNRSQTQQDSEGGASLSRRWTESEDAILMDYVQRHGEGKWDNVQKKSGLMRCSKSCRLRWINQLRPNIKRGSFSEDEERIIVHLHSKYGNKWARIASALPGRTDNEIKNYWNARLKKREKAGLPIYPLEMRTQNPQHQMQLQIPGANYPSASSLVPQSLSSSPRQIRRPNFSASIPTVAPENMLMNSWPYSSFLNSPLSPPPAPSSHQGFSLHSPMPSVHFDSFGFGFQSRPVSGFEPDSTSIAAGSGSIQSLVLPKITVTGSCASDRVINATSSFDADGDTFLGVSYLVGNGSSSGLLENLVNRPQRLTSQNKPNGQTEQGESQENLLGDYKLPKDTGGADHEESGLILGLENVIVNQNGEDHSSIDRNQKLKGPPQETHLTEDDEYWKRLLELPVLDWYAEFGDLPDRLPENSTEGSTEKENQK